MVMLFSGDTKLLFESLVLLPEFSDFVGLLYDAVVATIDYNELAVSRSAASAACRARGGSIALFIPVSKSDSLGAILRKVDVITLTFRLRQGVQDRVCLGGTALVEQMAPDGLPACAVEETLAVCGGDIEAVTQLRCGRVKVKEAEVGLAVDKVGRRDGNIYGLRDASDQECEHVA